ncbi:MAG: hypothetical protein AAFY26_08780 [Cyanobacteria bacterium J06638_22]
MNTPAHVVLNLLCLNSVTPVHALTPIVAGAVLPDAPIFLFYFVEKVVRQTPENVIWTEAYYQPSWQNFIDLFNSLPLMALGMLIAIAMGSNIGILLFGSMVLHVVGDLPLHHDDGHRHFFPLSDWRFSSPVSYWDPNHYGHWVSMIEIAAVIVSCILLFQTYDSLVPRLTIGLVGTSYALYFGYVFLVWV